MKRLALLIFVVSGFALNLTAENYTVLYIKGKVKNLTTNKPVARGDQLSTAHKLEFENKEASLAVLSAERGRYLVQPGAKPGGSSELVAVVQDVLAPFKKGKLSTRGAQDEEGLIDIKSYFGTEDFVVLGDSITININPNKYPMNENQVFILYYEWKNQGVSKEIAFQGKTIILEREKLFDVNGRQANPRDVEKVQLYYYNKLTKQSQKVSEFALSFPDIELLKKEMKFTLEFLNEEGVPKEEKFAMLYDIILEFYGKSDQDVFRKWLADNNLQI